MLIKKDIIDQGILLWNTIHDTIAYYQKKYKHQWYFVKHEDLSISPLSEFKKMFSKVNLILDSNVNLQFLLLSLAMECFGW